MRVLLYIKKGEQPFEHIATATTKNEIYAMMEYATYKVSNGYDVKTRHEQPRKQK